MSTAATASETWVWFLQLKIASLVSSYAAHVLFLDDQTSDGLLCSRPSVGVSLCILADQNEAAFMAKGERQP